MNLTKVFKLLSDESRIRVIHLLSHDALCVCEIVGVLEMPQPKVSKVLSKLRDMDLVDGNRRDKFIFYSLKTDDSLIKHILDYIDQQISEYPTLSSDLKRLDDKFKFVEACSVETLKEIHQGDNNL